MTSEATRISSISGSSNLIPTINNFSALNSSSSNGATSKQNHSHGTRKNPLLKTDEIEVQVLDQNNQLSNQAANGKTTKVSWTLFKFDAFNCLWGYNGELPP